MKNLSRLLIVAVAFLVSACGDGGDAVLAEQPATPATHVRFEAAYDFGPSVSTPTQRSLAIRPAGDDATIASNSVAKVEVQVGSEPAMSLTLPNGLDVRQRPQFVFTIPVYQMQSQFRDDCRPMPALRITVTDVTGFTFSKYVALCPTKPEVFAASSDYGSKRVTFSGSATSAAEFWFGRTNSDGSYFDVGSVGSSNSFSLPAEEGDRLGLGLYSPGPTAGTVRIAADGGAFAESTGSADSYNYVTLRTSLICCRAPAGTATYKVRLEIGAYRYVAPPDSPPVKFGYHYRITDPAAGAVIAEQTVTAQTYAKQLFDMTAGWQISAEAVPHEANSFVRLNVAHLTNPDDPNAIVWTLGEADSTVVGTAARINAFCCSR